jgi:hypothetical protein
MMSPDPPEGTAMPPFDRRDFLRLGTIGLAGLALPGVAAASAPRARSCILLYMDGGPSHLDLWDLKPDAPAEVRGPFRPIATTVAGVRVCEHLPLTSRQMHRLAQVRSVRHQEGVHDPAVYQMLTGSRHPSSGGGLTVKPDDCPHMACAFGRLDTRRVTLPRVIELPETMKMEARTLPGQNGARRALARRASRGSLDDYQRQALDLLSRPATRRAFDLSREPAKVRERYGMNRHGQSVLLARRLAESGARFVTVYWGKEMQDWADGKGRRPANNPWDTHRNHFPLVKDDLLPRADRALAALLEDLHARGLLGETLVVWMGDFGRTPKIDRKYASRDHWPGANTVLFAGAGVPAGAVIGRTDRLAAEVTDSPVSPADLTATIVAKLGVDPAATIRDAQGRPHAISEGRAIRALG